MTIALPYRFDSSAPVKLILRGAIGLLALIIIPGLLYVLLARRDAVGALQLLLIAALVAYFGRLFFRHLEVSRGVITAEAVHVEPTTLYGVRLAGPVGRFPMAQIEAVRVERTSLPFNVQGSDGESVRLIGTHGAPDILIARTGLNDGRILGKHLADALGLRYEETGIPGRGGG